MNRLELRPANLPAPENRTFFPKFEMGPVERTLLHQAQLRAGNNLVAAFEYGSVATNTGSLNSRADLMIVVEDAEAFHKRNMLLNPYDYSNFGIRGFTSRTLDRKLHTAINDYGFNYYYANMKTEDGKTIRVKYSVISKKNFIDACRGTLETDRGNEWNAKTRFGIYVAGRIQKAAILPLYMKESDQQAMETAINQARIEGIWLALALTSERFTLEELVRNYVSLSYLADLRVEKKDKIDSIIRSNLENYKNMVRELLKDFVAREIVDQVWAGIDVYQKNLSLTKEQAKKRLAKLKWNTAIHNYLINPWPARPPRAIGYAIEKVRRAIKANK
ncbi:phosphatidate cytidylyltransferase [Patescibacteria group bacterium]|nr:phosphatidate cytidylyltransferase [Patescibacteria group bacterium]